ncbi:family 2 glycosyl transferase [Kovacikia minuta CCNUW1]|uniref:family 2 glycosyl transferase n=1 Tax=Kovacikia minuta TaxID=2931930 RepID=UPI001CCBE399|nr:family 2 glycosyl transferase [Kovacikia minuta]UBF25916.1 family 2 glycosyl transferase [Kovacikia minuta CCNUW1]
MDWQVCIQYPNGKQRAIRSCKNRETALKYVDAIYTLGYPMHVAYIVRPTPPVDLIGAYTNDLQIIW